MASSGELALHAGASLRRLLVRVGHRRDPGRWHRDPHWDLPLVRSAALPVVSLLFAMPKIALLPVFIVWFGIGRDLEELSPLPSPSTRRWSSLPTPASTRSSAT